jgi:hypothetical protein
MKKREKRKRREKGKKISKKNQTNKRIPFSRQAESIRKTG